MPYKPVDTAIKVIIGPLIDDTDFASREEAIAWNAAGMEIDVIVERADGTIVTTAITLTTGGDYDWAHTNQGYYEIELPASGGASFNNTEEGILRVIGYCTGVLPFSSVSYDIVPTNVYTGLFSTGNLVATALSDINLDHLMFQPVANRDTLVEVVDDTVLANIITKTDGDTSDFNHATDSLEAIRDKQNIMHGGLRH